MKNICYIPEGLNSARELRYSTDDGMVIIKANTPVVISKKAYDYLIKNIEEFKKAVDKDVITADDVETEDSSVFKVKEKSKSKSIQIGGDSSGDVEDVEDVGKSATDPLAK